jgi:drug/metabolite transporter (DMT)-like permease
VVSFKARLTGKEQRVAAAGTSPLVVGPRAVDALRATVIHGHRIDIPASVVGLALAGALCYAVASALQHRAAARQPDEAAVRPRLLVRLAQRPGWLLGNVVNVVGYVCQFLALRRGSQSLVQPLLLTALIFALPTGALLEHDPISGREVAAAAVAVAGVGGFVILSKPGSGNPNPSALAWALLTFLVAATVGAATLATRGASHRKRGVLLAISAGTLFGYASAVAEHIARLLDHGVLPLLTSWAPYALVAAGAIGLLLAQSAFQAGDLRISLPALTVAEPLVAIAIGHFLFGERIASGGIRPVLEALSLAVMVAGVFLLAAGEPEAAPTG